MGRTGILAFLTCALALGTTAWGTGYNDAQDGLWNDPATWGGGGVPATGDTATISTYQVDLDMHLQGGDAPDLLTLAGGTLAAPGENWKRNIDSPISVTAASGLHIAGVSWSYSYFQFFGALTGAGDLTVTGHPTYPVDGGRLYLAGDGTGYSGNWDIQANRVFPQTDGALGTGEVVLNGGYIWSEGGVDQTAANAPALVTVNSGGITLMTGNRIFDGWDIVMTGGELQMRKGAKFTNGTVAVNGDVFFTSAQGGPCYVNNDLSGAGKVTLNIGSTGGDTSTGQVGVGGDNTAFTGEIVVPVGTSLLPGSATWIGTGTCTVDGGALNLTNLPVDLTGAITFNSGKILTEATSTIDAAAVITANGDVEFYQGRQNATLTVDGKITGAGGVRANGLGWLDWGNNGWVTIEMTNADNDYAGDTVVQFENAETGDWYRGNLKVTADGALSNTNVEVLNSRLTTEPADPNDAVFTSVNAVNVRGGTLVLTSTEDDGKIHLYEGGALDEAGGSTTMTYGAAGNVHIHSGAILPEDWNSALGNPMPLASEIESGGKIYLGLRGDGSTRPTLSGTYATSDTVQGVATFDNWPTLDGTVTDASGDGISLLVQDLRHMTLNGASLQTAGPINLEGGGDYGLFNGYNNVYASNNWTGFKVQGTNNFAGMTGDKVVNMNARAVLYLANGGAIPADTTVEMNGGLLVCDDPGAVAGTVNLRDGSTLMLDKDLTSGTINATSGSAVWVNADSRFASVSSWDGGAKGVNVVLAADGLASAPADGSVNYLRTERNYNYGGAMVLGDNNRITVAPDFSWHKSGEQYYFVDINATSVDVAAGADSGRIAMLTNDANTYLMIDCPLNFAGKTLVIGDQSDFMSTLWTGQNWNGQNYWEVLPQFESIDQKGIVMFGGDDIAAGYHEIGDIDIQGGTLWVPGYYYPDPDKLGGAKTINIAQGAKMLFTARHAHFDWTVNAMITGNGTVAYRRVQRENLNEIYEIRNLILASDFDTEGGLAPGNSVGALTVEANLGFAPTDIDRYAKVKIDVADHSGDHDLVTVTGTVANLANADLVATLAVPSVDCKPASVNALFLDAAAGGIAGGDTFHSVASGLLDAATGLDQTTRERIRDHWDLSADDVAYDTVNGDVSLVLDAADWTAIPGDADLDGSVLLSDLSILAFNWESDTGMTWLTADFDFNGVVNLADLSELAFHWEETEAGAPPVPEPMTVGLLLVGAAAVIRRRRR